MAEPDSRGPLPASRLVDVNVGIVGGAPGAGGRPKGGATPSPEAAPTPTPASAPWPSPVAAPGPAPGAPCPRIASSAALLSTMMLIRRLAGSSGSSGTR